MASSRAGCAYQPTLCLTDTSGTALKRLIFTRRRVARWLTANLEYFILLCNVFRSHQTKLNIAQRKFHLSVRVRQAGLCSCPVLHSGWTVPNESPVGVVSAFRSLESWRCGAGNRGVMYLIFHPLLNVSFFLVYFKLPSPEAKCISDGVSAQADLSLEECGTDTRVHIPYSTSKHILPLFD